VGVEMDFETRSFKAQMRAADGCKARYAAIFGEEEVAGGTVTLKALATGEQETLPIADALARLTGDAPKREG